jgi:bisanhydrobacterioruberin hydratase
MIIFYITSILLIASGFLMPRFPYDSRFSIISSIFVVLFSLPSFYYLFKTISKKNALLLLLLLSVFAYFIESTAIKTGFPYGHFYYTDKVALKLFSLVPWTLPFAWIPLVLGTTFLGMKLFNKNPLKVIISSAFLLVLTDMVLDPGAVALDFWRWAESGVFYRVPFTNFLGWFLSGAIGSAITYFFLKKIDIKNLPYQLSISLFLILIFWTSAVTSLQLWGAAMIGLGLILLLFNQLRDSSIESAEQLA